MPASLCWPRWERRQALPSRWRGSSTRRWSVSSRATASMCIRRRSASHRPEALIASLSTRPALRAAVIGAYVLLVEWTRALATRIPGAAVVAILLGGAALMVSAIGWPAPKLGLGTSRLGLRILGGFALAAVLLLPPPVRASAAPNTPPIFPERAVIHTVAQEVA